MRIVSRRVCAISVGSIQVFLALGGCSLVNPFVAPRTEGAMNRIEPEYSISEAVKYGNKLRIAYREAMSDQAILNNATGIALIPLTGVATSLGVRGVASNTVLGLGIGGAGAAIGADFLTDTPRQTIYGLGARSVTCVMDAYGPLISADALAKNSLPNPDREALPEVDPGTAAMAILIARLTTQTDELDASLRTTGATAEDIQRSVVAQAAVKALEDANGVLDESRQALALMQSTGFALFSALQVVEDEINLQVVATQASPQALLAGLTTQLRSGAVLIAPGLSERFTPTEGVSSGLTLEALNDQLRGRLGTTVRDVRRATATLQAIVDLLDDRPTPESVAACVTKDAFADLTRFGVIPAKLTLAKGSNGTVSIGGGKPPFGVEFVGATPTGVTAELQQMPFTDKYSVRVSVSAEASEGEFSLLVSDDQGQRKQVALTVGAAQSGGGATTGVTDPGRTISPCTEGGSGDQTVCSLQANLNRLLADEDGFEPLSEDGVIGAKTVAAVVIFLQLHDVERSAADVEAYIKTDAGLRDISTAAANNRAPAGPVPGTEAPAGGREDQVDEGENDQAGDGETADGRTPQPAGISSDEQQLAKDLIEAKCVRQPNNFPTTEEAVNQLTDEASRVISQMHPSFIDDNSVPTIGGAPAMSFAQLRKFLDDGLTCEV